MKKLLAATAVIALTAGVAVAQQQSQRNTNPKGIGAEVRTDAHAQHDSTEKGIGAEVSTKARAQRTAPTPSPTPTPTPTPTPSPSPTPTPGTTPPVGPAQ